MDLVAVLIVSFQRRFDFPFDLIQNHLLAPRRYREADQHQAALIAPAVRAHPVFNRDGSRRIGNGAATALGREADRHAARERARHGVCAGTGNQVPGNRVHGDGRAAVHVGGHCAEIRAARRDRLHTRGHGYRGVAGTEGDGHRPIGHRTRRVVDFRARVAECVRGEHVERKGAGHAAAGDVALPGGDYEFRELGHLHAQHPVQPAADAEGLRAGGGVDRVLGGHHHGAGDRPGGPHHDVAAARVPPFGIQNRGPGDHAGGSQGRGEGERGRRADAPPAEAHAFERGGPVAGDDDGQRGLRVIGCREHVIALDPGEHGVQYADPDRVIKACDHHVLPIRQRCEPERVGVGIQEGPGKRERAAVGHTGVAGEVHRQDLQIVPVPFEETRVIHRPVHQFADGLQPAVAGAEMLHDGRGAAGLDIPDGQRVQLLVDRKDRVLAGQVDGGLVQVVRVSRRGGLGREQIADHRRFPVVPDAREGFRRRVAKAVPDLDLQVFPYTARNIVLPRETEPGRGIAAGGGRIFVHVNRGRVINSAAADAVRAVAVGNPDRVRNFAEAELERLQPAIGPNGVRLPRQAPVTRQRLGDGCGDPVFHAVRMGVDDCDAGRGPIRDPRHVIRIENARKSMPCADGRRRGRAHRCAAQVSGGIREVGFHPNPTVVGEIALFNPFRAPENRTVQPVSGKLERNRRRGKGRVRLHDSRQDAAGARTQHAGGVQAEPYRNLVTNPEPDTGDQARLRRIETQGIRFNGEGLEHVRVDRAIGIDAEPHPVANPAGAEAR